MLKKLKLNGSDDLQDLPELTPKRNVFFIIGDGNAKVGSQEIPGVTGKFGLGVQNEAGQRLTELCQEDTLVITYTLFQQHKRSLYAWTSADGQYKIRLIIYSAAKDGEALYSQQGEGDGTLLQDSCLENPMDRGAR